MVLSKPMSRNARAGWLERPHQVAVLVYVVASLVYGAVASRALWQTHTPYNHFALLAESWLHHRLDLGSAPPLYAAGNDFAFYADRWFITFPFMPALLILPWVAMAGSAENTLDGLFFLLLSGLGPAGMYLTLDRIRRLGLGIVSRRAIIALTALYALGTVYFFTAIQGTVWFAAHVVAAAATTFFLYASIGMRNPLGAGIALAIAVGTRPVLGALGLFFLFEWWRLIGVRVRAEPRLELNWLGLARRIAKIGYAKAFGPILWFGLPVAATLALLAWHNWARFGSPTEFGYRYLTVAWHARIEKWGLFGYHYLARNLGLVLTSLPFVESNAQGLNVAINGHGLALWVTTPLFLWLLWPRHTSLLHRGLYATLALVALPSLLYQNSGWLQFGQRFSNDYAPLLVTLLAVGGYQWGRLMKLGWVAGIAINWFGAVTFGRAEYARYYYVERTQRVIYQPD